MTPAEHAEQRARDYVRDRAWRQAPLSWEEVAELIEWGEDYLHIDDVIERIAGVKMSKAARAALADAFGVAPEDLTPAVVA